MAHHFEEGPGDRAFAQALQEAFAVLRARLTRRYGDPQLAEEISWDCLTRAYEVWRDDPAFFAHRDLTSWTGQRATWRALDRLRERGRFAPLAEEHSGDASEGAAAPLADPADAAAERRRLRDRQVTWRALQRLEAQDREILEGYYYDDLTDQQIGSRLYGDEGSEQARGLRVWRRRRKAQERLRTLLEEGGIDPSDYAPVASQAV
jgi:DNA-directed RNA polymerase specialized sigma24 family protein